MKSPNRKGLFKLFKISDVEEAKKNGWEQFDKPKAKSPKKSKGDK